MAKSFMQMAEEAMAEVEGVGPLEVQQRREHDPDALVVDVRDAADVPSTGLAARGANISLGNLPIRADPGLHALVCGTWTPNQGYFGGELAVTP